MPNLHTRIAVLTATLGEIQALTRQAQEDIAALLDEVSTGAPPPTPTLSPREAQLCEMIALGLTDQQIATRMVISLKTVSSHKRAVFRKLDVTSRTQAAMTWQKEQTNGRHSGSG